MRRNAFDFSWMRHKTKRIFVNKMSSEVAKAIIQPRKRCMSLLFCQL